MTKLNINYIFGIIIKNWTQNRAKLAILISSNFNQYESQFFHTLIFFNFTLKKQKTNYCRWKLYLAAVWSKFKFLVLSRISSMYKIWPESDCRQTNIRTKIFLINNSKIKIPWKVSNSEIRLFMSKKNNKIRTS